MSANCSRSSRTRAVLTNATSRGGVSVDTTGTYDPSTAHTRERDFGRRVEGSPGGAGRITGKGPRPLEPGDQVLHPRTLDQGQVAEFGNLLALVRHGSTLRRELVSLYQDSGLRWAYYFGKMRPWEGK